MYFSFNLLPFGANGEWTTRNYTSKQKQEKRLVLNSTKISSCPMAPVIPLIWTSFICSLIFNENSSGRFSICIYSTSSVIVPSVTMCQSILSEVSVQSVTTVVV